MKQVRAGLSHLLSNGKKFRPSIPGGASIPAKPSIVGAMSIFRTISFILQVSRSFHSVPKAISQMAKDKRFSKTCLKSSFKKRPGSSSLSDDSGGFNGCACIWIRGQNRWGEGRGSGQHANARRSVTRRTHQSSSAAETQQATH